ncbi:MAG: hypothetical protein HYU36_23135 [Planctomycetes bacterium]|nr:hypothetical protein [Planctomycetota bacterium]
MDLSTHLTLGAKLLDACGFTRRAVLYALLPEIDVKPAHFHRMFGNILMFQTTLLDTAIEVFRHPEVARREFASLRENLAPAVAELQQEHQRLEAESGPGSYESQNAFNRFYCYRRLVEELPGFFEHLDRVRPFLGDEILRPSTDRTEAAVSLLSHTYFLTYTYPPMPFIPFSPMASQRIVFADRIDYFEFKGLFSDPESVSRLCRCLVDHPVLGSRDLTPDLESDPVIRERIMSQNGRPYDPFALVKAMIERLGELAPGIDYDAVQKGIRWYLGYLGCVRVIHSDRERHFLEQVDHHLEETLTRLMEVPSGAR